LIYLQKFLPFLFLPITLIIVLLVGAIVTKKRTFIALALSLLILFSLPITSKNLVRFIEGGALKLQPIDVTNADAVVVLGGFIGRVNSARGPVLEWGNAARFFAGIELMKAQKAPFLILTNEKLPWMPEPIPVGEFLASHAIDLGIPKQKILITRDVQNTQDEVNSVSLLSVNYPIKNIILVTSAFHMKRAKFLFENAGFIVTPYPVNFANNADELTILDFIPNAGSLMHIEIAIRELIAQAFYKLKYIL
jgi:uncharacterized SAM-binding protein YcdF (DUF218 family)